VPCHPDRVRLNNTVAGALTLTEMLRYKADELERTRQTGPSVVMLLRAAATELEERVK
jgi:hypothetical protein